MTTIAKSGASGTRLPFEIQKLEWITQNRPGLMGMPRRAGFFEIIWIQKASGTCSIDLEKHAIRENMVYCIDIRQLYLLEASEDIKGYYLSFSPQFLYLSEDNTWPLFETKGYTQSGMAGVIQVDDELQAEMEEIMSKMIKEFANLSLLRSEILKGLLKVLMIYLARRLEVKAPEMATSRYTELLKRFMLLLEDNITRRKMVSDYASELGITPSHLNDIVKKTTGYPVYYHIQQRKVLEAKRQAIYYGISMKEIAYYLGFEDLAHFSKFFKSNAGLTFQSFKKGIAAG